MQSENINHVRAEQSRKVGEQSQISCLEVQQNSRRAKSKGCFKVQRNKQNS